MRSRFAGLCGATSIILGTTAICLVGCKKVDDTAQQPAATITVTTGANQDPPAQDTTDDDAAKEKKRSEEARKSGAFERFMAGDWADLMVDNETGCEYIVQYKTGRNGGEALPPIPRMGADHQQICRKTNIDSLYDPKLDYNNPAYVDPDAAPKKKH